MMDPHHWCYLLSHRQSLISIHDMTWCCILHKQTCFVHATIDHHTTCSDVNMAGNKDDYTSTFAPPVYFDSNLILWISSKQQSLTRSSTNGEYRALANTADKLSWIQSFLTELIVPSLSTPSILFDNLSATYIKLAWNTSPLMFALFVIWYNKKAQISPC